MLVQLLALYTNPDSHNAQRYRQTDDDDMMIDDTNSWLRCVEVRSAKNAIKAPKKPIQIEQNDTIDRYYELNATWNKKCKCFLNKHVWADSRPRNVHMLRLY